MKLAAALGMHNMGPSEHAGVEALVCQPQGGSTQLSEPDEEMSSGRTALAP